MEWSMSTTTNEAGVRVARGSPRSPFGACWAQEGHSARWILEADQRVALLRAQPDVCGAPRFPGGIAVPID
jgi:hypothetical protein